MTPMPCHFCDFAPMQLYACTDNTRYCYGCMVRLAVLMVCLMAIDDGRKLYAAAGTHGTLLPVLS